MRRELIGLFCVAGMIIFGIGTASAVELEWTLLMDSSIAGAEPQEVSPGTFLVLPGSTGPDNCNFSADQNCETGATPSEGSYSFSALEYDDSLTHSCLDLGGGAAAGAPCICSEGGLCTSDADCSSGSCAGAGDCCPGGPLTQCLECAQDPTGMDAFSYFGIHPTLGPAPNMDTCQVYTTNNFATTRYKVASSDTNSGGACIQLNPDNAPYVGSPCAVGQISGSLDVDVYVGGCFLKGTTIQNINYVGDVIDVDDTSPSSQCGYTQAQLLTMLAQASAKGGEYLQILCGETTIPADSKTVCLKNAETKFVTVAYTAGDASDCGGTCP